MIQLENRILLNDGTSLVDDEYALQAIMKTGAFPKHLKISDSEDARSYNYIYNTDVIFHGEPDVPDPEYIKKFDFDDLVKFLADNPRDDTPNEKHIERLFMELDYFIRSENEQFLGTVKNLIEQLDQDHVVHGGRGSSCASYVLYLLNVHPVNPILYDIDFREFSKEK